VIALTGKKPRSASLASGLRQPAAGGARAETLSLLIFLAAVFALKLAVMVQLNRHVLTQPDAGLDTTAYVALAQRVIDGDVGLGPGLYFLSPLYIYFLAAVLAVTPSFTAVRLVQVVLGTAATALVYVAANEWFGRRAAWIAGSLAALTGLFTFYESLLLQTALDPFLTAASMACLALALRRRDWHWYVLSGLAFGVQTCNRPNVAIPSLLIALLLAAARQRRAAVVFAAAVALALTPVTLRNIVVSSYWSPVTSSHGGLNFYIGNNAQADGTYRSVPEVTPDIRGQQEDTRRVAEKAVGHALDDASVSDYFYGLGWAWIREQPGAATALFARKLSLMFSAGYIWLNYSYPFFVYDAGTLLRVLFVGPWILIPLGLVGFVVAAPTRDRLDYLIWISFVPAYAIAVAAFYVADRYQLPLLIPLCVGAGAALDALIAALSARRWPVLAFAAAAGLVVFGWVNRPLAVDNGVAEERTRMAERLVTLGRYEEAEGWADRAAQAHPHPGVVHFRFAQRLLAHDRSAAAIAHFEKALEFDSSQPIAEYALGEALLEAERPSEAIRHLRRAFDAGVRVDQVGYDLVRALGAAGDRLGAIGVLRTVRPAREDDAQRWAALGQLAVQLVEPDLADMFCRRALAVQPDFAPAHATLGIALNLRSQWTEAARELTEAVRLDPRDANAHIDLAVADASMGRRADARLHIKQALQLEPTSERGKRLQQALGEP
jgi:tetratricopeptide (TPR) repeat protein